MLATIELKYKEEDTQGATVGTLSGIVDVRLVNGSLTTLATVAVKARTLEGHEPVHERMPIGCREALYREGYGVVLGRVGNPNAHVHMPRKSGESIVHEFKRHYHRKSKSYNTITMTIKPISIPRVEKYR